jgi:hypothetical protein
MGHPGCLCNATINKKMIKVKYLPFLMYAGAVQEETKDSLRISPKGEKAA